MFGRKEDLIVVKKWLRYSDFKEAALMRNLKELIYPHLSVLAEHRKYKYPLTG